MSYTKILQGLIALKFKSGLHNFFARIYFSFTFYDLTYKLGNGNCPIFYAEDRIHRAEFKNLLKAINDQNKEIFCFYFFSRKFTFFPVFSVKKNLESNLFKIWKKNFSKSSAIINFCSHTLSGFVMQEIAHKNNQKVLLLQHGYYSFSDIEFKFFSLATKADIAYTYSREHKSFFVNCQKIKSLGFYHGYPIVKKIPESGVTIFFPYINKDNLRAVVDTFKKITSKHSNIKIKFHPRQSKSTVCLDELNDLCSNIHAQLIDQLRISKINFFIQTTAWMNFDINVSLKVFFVNSYGSFIQIKRNSRNIQLLSRAIRADLNV